MSWIELFLGFKGRLARRTFWLASLLPAVVHSLAATAHDAQTGGPMPAFAAGVAAYSIVMLNTKRLHDLGKSGWQQLALLASIGFTIAAYLTLSANNAPLTLVLIIAALAASLWSSLIVLQMVIVHGDPLDNRFGAPQEPELIPAPHAALQDEVADIMARAERKKAPKPYREPTLEEILAATASAETRTPSARFGRRRRITA